ncbi:MAG: glycosyltransferase [Myxococcaceae bacterium]
MTTTGSAGGGLHEVEVSAQPLERFSAVVDGSRVREGVAAGERLRALMAGRPLWSINSTALGGGVAEMLRPLLAYARGAGIDAHWLVIRGDAEFFRITKRVHNSIHGDRGDGSALGKAEREHYEHVMRHNADLLLEDTRVKKGDLALLHDPQTAGLAVPLSEAGVHVVWRCHIGTEATNAETDRGWAFLAPYLSHARAMVFSRAAYVPKVLASSLTRVIQPSIDPFSTKNQELPDPVVRDVLATTGLVGAPTGRTTAAYPNADGTLGEVRHAADVMSLGGPPAFETPLVVQLSRWDTLKDHKGVMQGFVELLENGGALSSELLLCGPNVHAVADDPDGDRIFNDVVVSWRKLPHEIRRRVHLACLPVHDVDENATIVNALQRHAAVVVQKSLQEGFGLTVTEPMWKARPVVASRVGGIPDQIVDGESGLLLDDPTDLAGLGRLLGRVLSDRALAERLGAKARERVREHFLGLRHLVQYAEFFELLLK